MRQFFLIIYSGFIIITNVFTANLQLNRFYLSKHHILHALFFTGNLRPLRKTGLPVKMLIVQFNLPLYISLQVFWVLKSENSGFSYGQK